MLHAASRLSARLSSLRIPMLALLSLSLAACSGGGGGDSSVGTPTSQYHVVVGVNGLAGSGLVLQLNGGGDLAIAADGSFAFLTQVADGAAYNVTVKTPPASPAQNCSISGASGVIAGGDVNDVFISCSTSSYTIGGSLSGLSSGAQLVVQNNGGDDVTLSATGAFGFGTPLIDMSPYSVTVKSFPSGQYCGVTNGSGTLAGADVSNVAIACETGYTVGGTVTGLSGSGLVLQNNGGDKVTVSGTTFTFPAPMQNGASYAVTVATQPSGPGQQCTVSSGTGLISSSDVTSVAVNCVAKSKYKPGYFNSTHLGSDRTFAVALGDIDKDGDADMVAGHINTAIWSNDGSGKENFFGFAPSASLTNTEAVYGLALADLDGDNDLDLILGASGANQVWINQGGSQGGVVGSYANSGQALGSASTVSVTVGDVDNDGDLDLVEGNNWSQHAIWLNDGSGNFGAAPSQQFGETQVYSYEVKLADIDKDGDLDILEARSDNNIGLVLWINQGGKQGGTVGAFSTTGVVVSTTGARALDVGDVDGDGDLDVAVGSWGPNTVWLNDGNGNLTNSGQSLGDSDTSSLKLADFDGDGDLDMVTGNDWSQPDQIWLNSNGVFTSTGQQLNSGEITHEVAVADLDGDGDLDIMEGFYYGAEMWLNDGTGHFLDPLQHLGSAWTRDIQLVDLNLDGHLDLVEAAANGSNAVWLNDGTGALGATPAQTFGWDETTGSAVGDLNGDGYPDMVEANYLSSSQVRFNMGDGTFSSSTYFGPSAYSQTVALADLDGDGDRDIVLGSAGGGTTLWLNDGSGNFTDSGINLAASWTYDIAIGDTDGDGDLDMVFGESATPDGLWVNQGGAQGGTKGSFVKAPQILGGTYITQAVAMADLDNDGDLDLVFGYSDGFYSTPGDAIWINQGGTQGGTQGVFVDSGMTLDGKNTNALAVADIDDDGDADIIKGNSSAPKSIWLNQGGDQSGVLGTFVATPQTLSGNSWTYALAVGDLDKDGDLDLVEGVSQHPNLVYLNMTY